MAYTHTIVGHFPNHAEAERVVLELQKQGSIAGLIAGVLASWLEGTFVGGAGGAVGGLASALSGLGIPKHEVLKYETIAIRCDF